MSKARTQTVLWSLAFAAVGFCLAASRTVGTSPGATVQSSSPTNEKRPQTADSTALPAGETTDSAHTTPIAAANAGDGQTCASDSDCTDENPCTDDLCVQGVCTSEPQCTADEDCDDNNVCTIDACVDGCCETRPQCFGHDDCGDNAHCIYNCCVRCPSCHEIRGVRASCRRQWIRTFVNLRSEDCDGNTITLDVNGRMVDCDVKGGTATCLTRGKRGFNDVCVADPDCPDACDRVWCGR